MVELESKGLTFLPPQSAGSPGFTPCGNAGQKAICSYFSTYVLTVPSPQQGNFWRSDFIWTSLPYWHQTKGPNTWNQVHFSVFNRTPSLKSLNDVHTYWE